MLIDGFLERTIGVVPRLGQAERDRAKNKLSLLIIERNVAENDEN